MSILKRIKNYVRSPQQIVYTPDDTKNIADVKVGDILLGAHGAHNVVKKVEKFWDTVGVKQAFIEINGGDFCFYQNQTVSVNGAFKRAYQVEIGDKLDYLTGAGIEVVSVSKVLKAKPFYKFEISGDHTYYINGVLVHNPTLYWYGGTGSWSEYATHWSNNSGNSPASPATAVPSTSDDVVFDSNSNATAYTMTIGATANCAAFTMGAPASGAVTWAGSAAISIYGNFSLSGGAAGITRTYTGGITFIKASGTQTIDTNGVGLASSLTFNKAGTTFQLVNHLDTSGFNFTFSAGTFDGATNSKTVTLSGGTPNIIPSVALSFYNLTITPASPLKTNTLTVYGNFTVTNLFTVSNGATVSNRVLVTSNTVGTQRTITAASISTSNSDWMDIIGAGAASWDMSGDTGGSGNCGNNSMKALGDAAFTTPADQHWVQANGGTWSTAANWTSRMPLPQDNVFMDCAFGTAKTVTMDMRRLGKNVDWTGATWTTSLTLASSAANTVNGSLTLIDGLTISSVQNLIFNGTSASDFHPHSITIQSAVYFNRSSVTLKGDLTVVSGKTITIGSGATLSAVDGVNNRIISAGVISLSSGGTLTLGSATHLITGTTGTIFDGNGTITATTGTIKFTGVLTAAVTVQGRSKTYGNFWNATTGAYIMTVNGSNTWNDFKIDAGRSMMFENGSTNYLTTLTAVGTSGSHITLSNVSGTTAFHFSKASGNVYGSDYMDLNYSDATGGALWFAGVHSTNTAGSTGWRWVDLNLKELTEVVSMALVFTNLRGKTFTEIVQAVSSAIKTTGKTFTLIVRAISAKTFSLPKTFLENLTVSPTYTKLITLKRTLTEALKVSPVYARVWTVVRVFTQAIRVASSKLYQASRTFTETIRVASQRLIQTNKTFVEAITASPVFAKVGTFAKILTETVQVVSQKIYQAARIFIERLNVAPIAANVLTAVRTFIETINVAPALTKVLTATRTFVESVVVAPIYSRVWTIARTFTETVRAIGSILKNTGRTISETLTATDPAVVANSVFIKVLNEVVNATSAMGSFVIGKLFIQPVRVVASIINQSTLYKVLSEALSVAGNAFNQSVRVFIESLTVAPVLVKTATFIKILAENISVAGSKLYQASRTFVETITAAATYTRALNAYKILTETLQVGWGKLTHRSFTFLENIRARIDSSTFARVKELNETIVAGASWLSEKTQYVTLTDVVRASSQVLKATGRVFINAIRVASANLYSTARTFVENLRVGDWFQGARAFVFNEAVGVAQAFGNFVIGKLLKEIVRVRIIFTEGRNKIFTETLAVVGSITSAVSLIFTEVVNIGLSLTRSIGRILTQTVKMADTTRFRKTQYKVLSDALSVAGQAYKKAGKTFGEALAVASAMGNWVIGKVIVQPVRVVASYVKAWTLSRVFSEAVSVVGAVYNQGGKIFTEVIGVAENFVKTLLGITRYEFLQVRDVITKSMPKVFEETITVASELAKQTGRIFVEIVNVIGTWVLGTISKLLLEVVKVAEVFAKGGTFYKVLSETIRATGNVLALTGRIFTETINAIGAMGSFVMARIFTQTITVGASVVRTISRLFTQVVKVVAAATKQGGKIFTGSVGVSGALQNFNIGKLLTETVVAAWHRAKFVLNGIQVGLWKKVARVTNGIWRKINRNDN